MTHFAHGWNVDLIPRIRMAGVKTVRDEIYWNEVEPERGRFVFPERFERTMSALNEAGISPLIPLTFANAHYDGGQTPHTPAGFSGYARYAVEVLRHYGGEVGAVEIWNEYNGTFCEGPATKDRAATYVKMLRAAHVAIKAERADVTVAGGATAGVPLPYFEKLFAAGALAAMDVVSIHPYRTHRPPEGIEVEVGRLRTLIARFNSGKTKPIWVTEIGWSAGTAGADELTQAAYLARSATLLFSAGVERVYWYPFRDTRGFETMGLVFNDARYSPKAGFFALATLAEQLDGAGFVGRDASRSDFYALRFRRADGIAVRVVWSLRPVTITVAADAEVTNLLGEPRSVAGTLLVGEAPAYVVGDVSGLPAPEPGVLLADSRADFAPEQGRSGWTYGFRGGDDFSVLPDWRVTDWQSEWAGPHRSLAVSADGQHPAAKSGKPIAAVRRWRSDGNARVQVAGEFRSGKRGDGVGVAIRFDGQPAWEQSLGGAGPVAAGFDFVKDVRLGTVIDFSVDPGPAGNANFDATETAITIRDVTASSQPKEPP